MSIHRKQLCLIGYASGLGGADLSSAKGPLILKDSPFMDVLKHHNLDLSWHPFIHAHDQATKLDTISHLCHSLAEQTKHLTEERKFFIVMGGDHSCAIGSWSGAASVLNKLGLIWIDAHMDSHTPQTSPSGNIHGMPLATLLGYGEHKLTHILKTHPKILPENICLIGVRSYERGEEELLHKLNVRIFYMSEVENRGMDSIMKEAVEIVSKNTAGFGVSIDIDSIDPLEAPGTGVIEPNGISANDLIHALKHLASNPKMIGAEIAEFDPSRDHEHMTEKLIVRLISAITLGHNP